MSYTPPEGQTYSNQPPTLSYRPPTPGQGMAIASMVLGILGIFLFWMFAIVPILAIVFGAVSMRQSQRLLVPRSGMAIAGLTLGIIWTGLFVLWVLIAVSSGS